MGETSIVADRRPPEYAVCHMGSEVAGDPGRSWLAVRRSKTAASVGPNLTGLLRYRFALTKMAKAAAGDFETIRRVVSGVGDLSPRLSPAPRTAPPKPPPQLPATTPQPEAPISDRPGPRQLLCKSLLRWKLLAPRPGLEPVTLRLTAGGVCRARTRAYGAGRWGQSPSSVQITRTDVVRPREGGAACRAAGLPGPVV
jgi:hypothetical protein